MLVEGTVVGQWCVTGHLGRGGMGQVYRVQHRLLKNHVGVLKIPLAGMNMQRFEREWQALSELVHPNIVPIIDAGQSLETNGAYFVMKHLPGTLADRLDHAGQLDPQTACRLAAEIAGALDVAHKRGVVHRDVKPSNILLDEAGTAYLADFGVAHLADRSKVTRTGQQPGTEHYSSPEQIHDRQLGGASDQYALACLLYECLVGRPPFVGTTAAILYAHCFRDHDAPSSLANLPMAVDAVFERALSKDPEDRFRTVSRFAHALADAFGTPKGEAAPPPNRSDVSTGAYLVVAEPWLATVDASIADFAAAIEQWRDNGSINKKRLRQLPDSVTIGDHQVTPLAVSLADTDDLWADVNFDAVVRAVGIRRAYIRRVNRLVWIPSGGYGPGQYVVQQYVFKKQKGGVPIEVVFLERDDRKVGHLTKEQVRKMFPRHGSRWTDADRHLLQAQMRKGKPFEQVVRQLERTPSAILSTLATED